MKTSKITSKLCALLVVLTVFTASTAFGQDAKVIEIKGLNSMQYDKTNITVKPGQKVTIRLTTESDLPPQAMSHNLVLLEHSASVKKLAQTSAKYKDNEYINPNMADQIIAYTDMASGGETVEVTFTAPEKPSKFMYICTFPGHFLSGMKGTLSVEK